MNRLDKVYFKECKKLSLSQMDELKADIDNKIRVVYILKTMFFYKSKSLFPRLHLEHNV